MISDWLQGFTQGKWGLAGNTLEIAILGALIYSIIYYMRGTRGAGIVRGLVIFYSSSVILVLMVAEFFGFKVLSLIIEHLVGVSLVGAIIIFQPEIRRGLMSLGEGALTFFGAHTASLEKEISDAAIALAKREDTGALFVIERQTQIGGYIESGILMDAVVSAQLLRTIFAKNTPLHDGAVIIRQGRIAAANCLLPLSENIEVCRGMGTRHRAAIGLSEETDAMVIVVSEETGTISVAMHGQIARDLDYESLRRTLRDTGLRADVEDESATLEEE